MKTKFGLPVLGLMYLMVLALVGCTNRGSVNSANGAASSSSNLLSQSPLISCKVTNTANSSTILLATNLTGASNSGSPPVAPATVNINCGQSTSATGGNVSVYLSQNNGPFNLVSGNALSLNFNTPGVNVMSVKVVDGSGNTSTTTFNLPVSCNPSTVPAIQMAALTPSDFTQGSGGPGYLNIQIPAATGGSGGAFNYAIDLNGDGRFDDYNQSYWTAGTTFTNMYTLYNGTRDVTIRVVDTACEIEQDFSTAINFASILPAEQSGGTATAESYYYLQGQVSSLSGSEDAADNVAPFDAMENATVSPPKHVLCSYANGQFNITGTNTYSDGNTTSTESLLAQDMELQFTVNDAGGSGSFTQTVPLTKLTYQTAASPDGSFNQYTYNMDTSCSATTTISRQTAVAPCTSGTGTQSPVTTILGTYSCSHLTAPAVSPNPNSKAVSVTNGYFYCQVAPADNCSGGGGGGGGEPPPQF